MRAVHVSGKFFKIFLNRPAFGVAVIFKFLVRKLREVSIFCFLPSISLLCVFITVHYDDFIACLYYFRFSTGSAHGRATFLGGKSERRGNLLCKVVRDDKLLLLTKTVFGRTK